jgi:hypothetical protein
MDRSARFFVLVFHCGATGNGRRFTPADSRPPAPKKGVMLMRQYFALQYVTYENLFGFSLVMIGVAGLVLTFFSIKRK